MSRISPEAGVRGLFYLKLAGVGWFVLSTLFWSLLIWRSSFELRTISTAFGISSFIWLGLGVGEVALLWTFSQGRSGTAAESLSRAAFYFALIVVSADLLSLIPELGGPGLLPRGSMAAQGIHIARSLVGVAGETCLWLALVKSLKSDPGTTPAFFVVLYGGCLVGLLGSLPHQALGAMATPLYWLRVLASLTAQLLMLSLLKRLFSSAPSAPLVSRNLAAPPAGREIVFGLVWLGGGLLVTLLSYSAASSGSGGGRYFVTSGAVAYGLVRLIRGLVRLGSDSTEPPR